MRAAIAAQPAPGGNGKAARARPPQPAQAVLAKKCAAFAVFSAGRPAHRAAMRPIVVLFAGIVAFAGNTVEAAPPPTFPYPRPLPEPTAERLPRWRGFNLLYHFNAATPPPPAGVMEEDFRLIAGLGFNFVRVPMDYRRWIADGDWLRIDERKLGAIDTLVALGAKYGVHVCLNFHRAPGYTVAKPAEPRSLWTDAEAQAVCARQWAAFARRYRGVPNARLSFNLFNEPAGVGEPEYFAVVERVVAAIRAEDPQRLIICDGLDYGGAPPRSLRSLGVALSTRGYRPMTVSHYRASWVAGAERWAEPEWPAPQVGAYLYGPAKRDLHGPLAIAGPLGGTTLTVHVQTVSTLATLRATDERGVTLWEKAFQPGPGSGEWKSSELRPAWKSYQAIYDREYRFDVPAGTSRIELRNIAGDWATVTRVTIEAAGRSWSLRTVETWGLRQGGAVQFDPATGSAALVAPAQLDRAWLRDTVYAPWREAAAAGFGVIVGEAGAFRHTPHGVVLRWLDDVLATAQEAGWGWALWEFRGGFGVLDSGRSDVAYEAWEGHQLDRALLDILQRR